MTSIKTNAMRILDQKNIEYKTYTYDAGDGKIDGIAVAQKIHKEPALLYKTLVTRGASRSFYVFLVCVEDELDLKKAAKCVNEKSIELVQVKELLNLTGYVRGGCSPIGMKKPFRTFIDNRVGLEASKGESQQSIIVSGGKIGIQLELPLEQLLEAVEATLADLCKK